MDTLPSDDRRRARSSSAIVQGEAAELDAPLAAVPGVGDEPELTLSDPMIQRYEALGRDARG